jgi:hypothetical protein
LLQPHSLAGKEFSAQPEPWLDRSPVRHPRMELQVRMEVDDRLPDFDAADDRNPAAPGPEPLEVSAADWLPGAACVPDAEWSGAGVRLPDASLRAVPARTLESCGPAPGLLAEAVEAFLPPGPEPHMEAYGIPAATISRWTLRPTDWVLLADLAMPAAGPAAEAVEAFLPPCAEPQMATWPAAAVALPRLTVAATERAIAVAMAGPVAGPAAEAVEAFLPPFAEPQMVTWPAAAAALPRLTVAAADWAIAAAMADPVAGPAAEAVEAFLPPLAEPQMAAWPAAAVALPQLTVTAADLVVAVAMADPVAAPAAEAVEAFLPTPAEPQIVAWPAVTAAMPRLTLDPAAWALSVDLAEAVAAPAAEAVEAFLPAAEPQIVAWPAAAAALPLLTVAAADWTIAAALAELASAPAAEAVEAFLPAAEPQIAAWPAAAAALPLLTVAAADWTVAAALAEPASAPAPEAVESLLPAAEPQIVAWPAAAVALPLLTVSAADWTVAAALAEPASAPAAEAVEAFLPAAEPQIVAWPAAAAALPHLTVSAADWTVAAALAEAASAPAAEAVESLLPLVPEPCAIPFHVAALQVPELTLAAIQPEPLEEFVPPLVIADTCESWMPGPPACEVVREAIPAFAGALPAAATLSMPAVLTLAMEQPTIRWAGDWRQSATAEPVVSLVAPRLAAALPVAFPLAAPSTGDLRKAAGQRAQNLGAPAVERYPEAAEPLPAGSPAIAASYRQSGSRRQVPRFPAFAVEHATGNRPAAFRPGDPSAAEPAAAGPNSGSATPHLDLASAIQPPAFRTAALRCGFPLAKPAGADFICQRTPMAPFKSLESIQPRISVLAPKFVVRPLFERIEEAAAPPKPVEKTPTFAEIFAISKATRRHTNSQGGLFSAGKLIAASLIVGLGMWIGAGGVKITRQMLAINAPFRGMGSTNPSSADGGTASPAPGFPSPRTAPKAPDGPIASVRRAIQRRAAVELTDTFRRMEAWGSNAMNLPTGWTRHPDGYVRTGQLALYRPAQAFADYHFEFFGEIEKKGMSWAVRARDTQNYYGMKMAVIEPGLRPVMAVVHYAVVGGKKGQRVETPLSMMMHNNEPYHVAVDVKGNRVITSIEGQEVDSWTDDALKVGGIGFFSEVGESARLYWMRVSKNQDWLGRVCAYLSSGSATDTADLWRGEIPQAPTQPSQPAPLPAVDVTLAAAEEIEDFSHIGPQRARILKYGRTELCRS